MFEIIIFGGFVYFVYLIGKDSGKGPRKGNPTPVRLPSGRVIQVGPKTVAALQQVRARQDARLAGQIADGLRAQGFTYREVAAIADAFGISANDWEMLQEEADDLERYE